MNDNESKLAGQKGLLRSECTQKDSQDKSITPIQTDTKLNCTMFQWPTDIIADSEDYVQVTSRDATTSPIEQMDGMVVVQNNQPAGNCPVCGHHVHYSNQVLIQHPQHVQHVTTISTLPGSHQIAGIASLPQAWSSTRIQWEQFFPSFIRSCDPREAQEFLQQGLSQLTSNLPMRRDSRRQAREPEYHQERHYHQNNHIGHELNRQQRAFEEYRQQSDLRIRQAVEREQDLQAMIDNLRAQVFAIGSSRAPRHEQNYYIQGFNALNSAIEQGVLKLGRHGKQVLSDSAPNEILAAISLLGKHGAKSAQFLAKSAYTIPAFYAQGSMRLALIRHIVALFITYTILEPYAMGVSKECSDMLKCIEAEFLKRGAASDVL